MKRVAALYDIHGNLPALAAVLHELEAARVDLVVIGGDVLPGPMSKDVLARLRSLKIPAKFIYGNCEVAVLAARSGNDPGRMPEQSKQAIFWTAERLSADEERALRSWPKSLTLEIIGLGEVLFCHGTPRDENEIFTRLTPEEVVAPAFGDVGAPLVVCGHTHMQFDRTIGKIRVVNAGSVGMPFGTPGADWLLLGPRVELHHTDYDLMRAAEQIRASDYPQAEEFIEKYLLRPPAEAEMLQLFTQHGMK